MLDKSDVSLTKVSHINTTWTLTFLYLHCVSKMKPI